MHTTPSFNHRLITIIAALLFLPASAWADPTDTFDRVLAMPRDGKVYLNNPSGNIDVKTWQRNQISVKARILPTSGGTTEDTSIAIKETQAAIWIKTRGTSEPAAKQSAPAQVHYHIQVPDRASLKIKSGGGDTRISGIGGSVDMRKIGGDVHISNVQGNINCEVIDGTIELVGVTGDMRIHSVSGTVRLNSIAGSVQAVTVSSAIVLQGLSALTDAEIKSITGNISVSGSPPKNGIYYINSFDGSITLEIFQGTDLELRAKSMNGKVTNDFQANVKFRHGDGKLAMTAGAGGANLNLSSFNGDIAIKKVKP